MRSLKRGIEVRWGLAGDEVRVAQLLELNGMPRWVACEERFVVAEKKGEVLATLHYHTASKRLLLGLLVTDPWQEERPLAVALYARAGELAREMGVDEVLARLISHSDYPYEAGYRRRRRGWWLDTGRTVESRGELPARGWRRTVALLGVLAIPFYRTFVD